MSEKSLEELAGELLQERNLRLAVAESCTGGLIGHRLTNIPGSSAYYMGSVTAYAYETKVRLLGVRWATLEKHGAVSQEVVLEMARGVRKALRADIGLAVSGIAGPGGGTPDKPVGLTWTGLSADDYEQAWRLVWPGDRREVKDQSAQASLQVLIDYLASKPGKKTAAANGMAGNSDNAARWVVEVTGRFDAQGVVYPQNFTWQGQTYRLESLGRRWQEGPDEHILAMTLQGNVFELVFSHATSIWRIKTIPGSPDRV